MEANHPRHCRTLLFLLLVALCAGSVTPAAAHGDRERAGGPPVRELARVARPLDDLRALEHMTGSATVVGVGEATHGSHEFFALKARLFRRLVATRGFTTFALEAPWSTGLRLNDYVLRGEGDPRRIMREEFQHSYRFWNTREYLDLITWMRRHNVRHPHHPVQFMGNDVGYAGPVLFDAVTGYTARHHPRLLPRVRELYRASRPSGSVAGTMAAYLAKPLAERRRMAADVNEALALLARQRPGPDPREHAWVLQHARNIAQVGTEYGFDLTGEGAAAAMLHRDRAMAENTVWWQRWTGHRMLLSAHNGHVGYESSVPAAYPRLQGAFLRDLLGNGYVSVGLTFGRGSFNAHDARDPREPIRRFTLGARPPGTNEHTLERVAARDYCLDLRTAPGAARAWLDRPRPTLSIGTAWPWDLADAPARLGASYDVLIHLHRITAARLL
ncbi:erythromycin esterase family protein [Streptomyces sp. NPDC050856]|uniref:erythromycin esterase family protein n=1 Tax=Streptomyces sp. NPDC050856 TaxID=3154939 RepID=UPI0033D4EC71